MYLTEITVYTEKYEDMKRDNRYKGNGITVQKETGTRDEASECVTGLIWDALEKAPDFKRGEIMVEETITENEEYTDRDDTILGIDVVRKEDGTIDREKSVMEMVWDAY